MLTKIKAIKPWAWLLGMLITANVLALQLPTPFSEIGKNSAPKIASWHPNSYYDKVIVLQGEIDDGPKSMQIAQDLLNAKSGDKIKISVLTPGGGIIGAAQIAQAMRLTKATVTYEVLSAAYSAGAVLACYSDYLYVAPKGQLLYHDVRNIDESGNVGPVDGEGRKLYTQFIDPCMTSGLLKWAEYSYISMGLNNDIILDGNDVNKRLGGK